MLMRLDHLVILVRDLDQAVRNYEGLGFAVTPGGEHADGLTRNALIPFGDGSYFELVAFLDPEDTRDNAWGWRAFLPSGGGLIDYCATSDDLGADARGLEGRGLGVEGPTDGGRRLPDGTEIRWRVARIRQDGRLLPFLIEDLTPRSLRVPGGAAAEHPNGAVGISHLEVVASDARTAVRELAALIGAPGDTEGPLQLGGCTISPVAPYLGAGRQPEAAGPGRWRCGSRPKARAVRRSWTRDSQTGPSSACCGGEGNLKPFPASHDNIKGQRRPGSARVAALGVAMASGQRTGAFLSGGGWTAAARF